MFSEGWNMHNQFCPSFVEGRRRNMGELTLKWTPFQQATLLMQTIAIDDITKHLLAEMVRERVSRSNKR